MGILIAAANLGSRIIRKNVASGKTGRGLLDFITVGAGETLPRKFAKLTKFQRDATPLEDFSKSPIGKFLNLLVDNPITQWAWDISKAAGNWIGKEVWNFIGGSLTGVWGIITNGIQNIWRFDWNAADAELLALCESRNEQIAAAWGSLAGQGIGWLAGIAVGAGVSLVVPVIGSAALARYIAGKTAEEALEELAPAFRNVFLLTSSNLITNATINLYLNYRRFLKNLPHDTLVGIFGDDTANFITNIWGRGTQGGTKLSFSAYFIEEPVERIDNKLIKTFVENLLEEAWDSFVEAGFVVASQLDTAYSQQKLNNQNQLGTQRSCELVLDTRAPDEKLYFQNVPQQMLIPAVQSAINTHRMIHNRDVGQIVGQPAEEWIRAKPHYRQLVILFYAKERPPWRDTKGNMVKKAVYSIPDVKVGVTWQEIKTAAKPFTWGKYRATANLDNGRQMAVYGATPEEAKKVLNSLLMLSTAKILTLSVTEEEIRPARLKKSATKMYPVYATLLARRDSVTGKGLPTLDNRVLSEREIRFELWVNQEPKNMPQLI
ncbi:hypothetical protein [Pantanalinema sp. GBBB05]|uniref:hypothetical protein n=1 Tax=Pantanalinema sp. GBBB05 TaxID=2604139 RepID=UPI001DF2BC56|nr:hypothetical protein [Pantanalinema sp. GBBB05]